MIEINAAKKYIRAGEDDRILNAEAWPLNSFHMLFLQIIYTNATAHWFGRFCAVLEQVAVFQRLTL